MTLFRFPVFYCLQFWSRFGFDALLQVIKEKEDSLSQLVATANALVLKERCCSGDLNRIRRERQEQMLLIR